MSTQTIIGLGLLASAGLLNQTAVRLNGGDMPTRYTRTAETKAWWLCDVFLYDHWGRKYSYSVGDIAFVTSVIFLPWWFKVLALVALGIKIAQPPQDQP